jgi:hypothetical protein
MSDEELIAQLKNSKGWPTLGNAAAARIEALTAKLAKAVEALLLARVHVANNEQGWSGGRASARYDLNIINATLAEIEGTNAP